MLRTALWLMIVAAVMPAAAGQEPSVPSAQHLAERMLARVKEVESSGLWTKYQFRRTSTRREFDENGVLQKHDELRYLMIPRDGVAFPQLLAKNGKPPAAEDLARETERFQRARRRFEERRRTGDTNSEDRVLSPEVLSRLQFTLEGREVRDGRSLLRVGLQPKANPPKPRTQTDKVLNRLAGKVWVDERLFDLVRAEVHLTQPVSFYTVLGVARKLDVVYQARLVDGTAWLPALFDMQVEARRLFTQIRTRQTEEYFEYTRADEGSREDR